MKRPLIGIPLEHGALRVQYFEAVHAAGGLAVGIPALAAALPEYLGAVAGLLIPGGDFPFPDEWYEPGAGPSPYGGSPSRRAAFDAALIRAAVARDQPLLGICAGMQALGAVFGCRLTHDVHRHTALNHRHDPAREPCHGISIVPATRLDRILERRELAVNSSHNEAIRQVAGPVTINARAPDGVIEGIELAHSPFALGVQWHPEWLIGAGPHLRLFEALVEAAGRYGSS